MIVDGAELADPFFALCVEGLYGEITAYVFDPANLDSRLFFDTWWGTVQGDVLSARLASLVISPAQRTCFSILREKYPQALISAGPPPENEEKISEACTSRLSGQDIEELHELISSLPKMEEISEYERRHFESNSHGLQPEHLHISLRAFVDDQTLKIPRLLAENVERLLSILFRSTKTEFTPSKIFRWNINDDPAVGVVAVGLALWGPKPFKQNRGQGFS